MASAAVPAMMTLPAPAIADDPDAELVAMVDESHQLLDLAIELDEQAVELERDIKRPAIYFNPDDATRGSHFYERFVIDDYKRRRNAVARECHGYKAVLDAFDANIARMEAEWEAGERQYRAECDALGATELRRQEREASERGWELHHKALATPAHGPRGYAAKVRLVMRYIEIFEDTAGEGIQSLAKDFGIS